MENCNATKHGLERVAQRSNCKDVVAYINRAYRNGKKPNTFTHPKFRKYLQKVASRSCIDAELRVFGNQIFVFSPTVELITVLDIPNTYGIHKYRK